MPKSQSPSILGGPIDCWKQWEEKAKSLPDNLLAMTIEGIRSQLADLDRIDRERDTCEGGIARDELSVLNAEVQRREMVRAGGRKCHCCGHRLKE